MLYFASLVAEIIEGFEPIYKQLPEQSLELFYL